jgi:Ca2+-dependent lipid-binding protein
MVYKSKTIAKELNPTWDETFNITVEDLATNLDLKVICYI